MDPLAVITTGVVTAVGLAAGVVQVVDYVHKVRNRRGDEPVRAVVDHQHHTADAIIHNLPPRGEFIGRDAEKRSLVEALNSRSHVICVDGIGGVGKTRSSWRSLISFWPVSPARQVRASKPSSGSRARTSR